MAKSKKKFLWFLLAPMIPLILLNMWGLSLGSKVSTPTPISPFIQNGDGTVTDKNTKLMWMRCSIGQDWNGLSCAGKAGRYSLQAGLEVDNYNHFAGYTDWRIPELNELATIIDLSQQAPSINQTLFPNTVSGVYWTVSPYISDTLKESHGRLFVDGLQLQVVHFGTGESWPQPESEPASMRLVRSGF